MRVRGKHGEGMTEYTTVVRAWNQKLAIRIPSFGLCELNFIKEMYFLIKPRVTPTQTLSFYGTSLGYLIFNCKALRTIHDCKCKFLYSHLNWCNQKFYALFMRYPFPLPLTTTKDKNSHSGFWGNLRTLPREFFATQHVDKCY